MKKTHFGFESVDLKDKQGKVNRVFDSVANRYDVMNDLMSLGLHRVWKHQAIARLGLKSGQKVLDLACGSGDLSILAKQIVGPSGMVVSTDINLKMLKSGQEKVLNQGYHCHFIQMDAQQIGFQDQSFDAVMVGFGLRNFPDIDEALKEIHRVLKPQSRLMILEFSKVQAQTLAKAYDFYSFQVLPFLGKWVAKDEKAYRYLAESIRKHPNQEELSGKLKQSGFDQVECENILNGIVAIHLAKKN